MKSRITFLLTFVFIFALGMGWLLGAVGPAPTPDENPEGETGALKPQVTTGGSYDAHSGNATRMVNDLHVPGALGMYGLDFTRYWNSIPNADNNEAAELPVDFSNSSWTHSWRWAAVYNEEITGDGEDPSMHRIWTTSITITYPDGHASKFKILRVNFGQARCRCGWVRLMSARMRSIGLLLAAPRMIIWPKWRQTATNFGSIVMTAARSISGE